jgi:aminopeptidase N
MNRSEQFSPSRRNFCVTKKTICLLLSLLGVTLISVHAETETAAIECLKSSAFLAPADSPDHRKYAPDRDVQVLHLALDVTPDFEQRTITGKAVWQFKPLIKPLRELRLDAVNLIIESVTCTEKIQAYQATDQNLIITFSEPIPTDKQASLTVAYRAEPTQGLYFRTPEMGYKQGDTHLFSQGEEIEARHWYPCFDSPNEKFTSEVTCHVPEGMTVVSNGRLVDQERDAGTGLVAFHWSQEKPHANYLITLVAGYFKKLEAKHKNVPLAFYTPPSEINEAAASFRDTPDIMEFFEQEIGLPYPWPKYDQVCVNDFVAGGMENTTATTLTDSTLFTDSTENIRDSEGLISHEMAHQWFGDLVTCKDWSHIWLNEGFATYYETLYAGHKHGRNELLYQLYGRTRSITTISNDVNAIVRRTYETPSEMFGYLAYPKGGWVLHMLRSQLGEDLYRRCIKTYLERHQYGSVVTEDLREVIEEMTGRSYDQFFDQWVYHAHHPELEVSYTWDEATKLARISIRQVQKLDDNVLLFNFPLTIRFMLPSGKIDRTVQVSKKDEDFAFALEEMPKVVRIDPDYTVFAKVTFNIPSAMLAAQLANQEDMIGRLLAIEQLATKHDKESVSKLKQTLNNDSFYGVRLEAARGLGAIHTDEAREALLSSMQQSDARVRREVVLNIGGFYHDQTYEALLKVLDSEKNPDIVASGLRGLGGYAKPAVHDTLLRFLGTPSYHNELADAAISAMRSQDDPVYIPPLMEALSTRQAEFTTRGFAQGLSALAYLSRNEEKKDTVREFLIGHVNDKRQTVQVATINGLGGLGDPKAIAVLEKFATGPKESRERRAAERAITDLRAARKPIDDFKNLRQEVLDLEKVNRDLRKELDELKKKVEARLSAPAAPPPKKKSQVTVIRP